MKELIISKRKLKIISIDEKKVKIDYNGIKITMSKGKWNKLMRMRSNYAKLYLSNDNTVIAVTSQGYAFIDNRALWDSIKNIIPIGWELKYEKVDDMILHIRYVLPVSIGFEQRPLFVLFNINDGKTSIRAYYGYFNTSCENGILTEEISLAFLRRHFGRWNIVIYETAKAIKNWRNYVDRLIKKREHMYEKISRDDALKVVKWLYKKKLILKKHLDKLKIKITNMEEMLFVWDFVNLITCTVEEDKDFLKNDIKWINLERFVGKIITSKGLIEEIVSKMHS